MFETPISNAKLCTYYLCDRCGAKDKFTVFEASFSESCDIKACYIMASSLHHAMFILYDQLASIWSKEYLDNHLLSVSFLTVLDNYGFSGVTQSVPR